MSISPRKDAESAVAAMAEIEPSYRPQEAVVETYNDHRIAMSFAIVGLKVPGIRIRNESCVEKSFPTFWQVFEELYQ